MRPFLRSLTIFALIGTAFAVPAFAQPGTEAQVSPYAACAGKPSQADTEAAHGAYMAGKGSFDEADYTTAINYFKDAYRRDCTKHELLVIIARAYELQGDRREAVHALETYLDRMPAAQDAEVQKRHIANLRRELIERAAASASASASGAGSASASPVAAAAPSPSSSAPVVAPSPTDTTPSPPSSGAPTAGIAPSPRQHSVGPWVLIVAGGAAAITGGVLFGVGTGQVSSAESVCGSSHLNCPAGSSAIGQGNSGRTNESVGVAVGAVGLAAVVGGIIWHFAEPTGSTRPKSGRPSISPEIGPRFAGVGVTGSF